MIDLTITRQMLGTVLQSWFHNIKNAEQAKAEILALFSEEPGDGYTWSEQDMFGPGGDSHCGPEKISQM